jgi:hypothetical protein
MGFKGMEWTMVGRVSIFIYCLGKCLPVSCKFNVFADAAILFKININLTLKINILKIVTHILLTFEYLNFNI